MVEPFAAVVFNSLLSGRSTLGHSFPVHSAARAMTRPLRFAFTPDFFTPQPRRVKGKEKAWDPPENECSLVHLAQCREWSCAMRHSLWCSKMSRLLMMKEIIPRRDRSSRRHPSHHLPHATTPRPPSSPTPMHGVHLGQKRHSSNISEALSNRTPSFPQDRGAEALQKFRSTLEVTGHRFDMEAGWDAYNSVMDCEALHSLTVQDLLAFSDKLVTGAEKHYDLNADLDTLHDWGHRARSVLDDLESRTAPLSLHDHQRQCLLARSMALIGDLQLATSIVHRVEGIPLVYEDRGGTLRVYESIIRSTQRHYDDVHVLEFLIMEWNSIGSHMTKQSSKWHHATPALLGRSLRQTAYAILANIEQPESLLADRRSWPQERRQRIGELFIEVLCTHDLSQDALAVLHEMRKQHLSPPISMQLTLVRALVRADAFDDANTLYLSLHPASRFKYHLSTGLYLFAHQGDAMKAEKYYNLLAEEIGWITEPDTAMLIYSYAVQGRTEQAIALFNDFFPEGPDSKRNHSPSSIHYSIIIYAHAQSGDFAGMSIWLEKMKSVGIAPDVYVYSIILKSFALRGDMDSIATALTQMRTAGIKPNLVSYTTIITLLAHRKDPVGAEAIFKRAIREGIIPDRRMVTSVMNAHVEAGSWKGVIRAFDYLRTSRARHLRLSIEVYNTLLKAYVLIGAPFRIVSKLFSRLENAKVRPDAYTFALLIQSACDAGLMDVASDIFVELDKLADQPQYNLCIDAYVLTILMAGFLRTGDKIRAKAVYDDMRTRGIQPTSITFGTILKAYGNERTEESLQIAEEFVKSLVNVDPAERVWNKPSHGRKSALDHIYGPLMSAYARQEKPEDVERIFQAMLDAGGEPSLGVLTTLLNAYRRTFNIEAVQQVWPQIFRLGLRYSRVSSLFEGEDDDPTRPRLQANILCIPLSIYIDALSSAGLHLEIAAVWKKFQSHGLSFDSHNWNHLVVALVRAGEPERAFEIIERVILPYQRQSKRILPRDPAPDTPLTFDDISPRADLSFGQDTSTPLPEGPMHSATRRAKAVTTATHKISPSVEDDDQDDENNETKGDFVHPLHVLHQISPSWNVWSPHSSSLSVLLMVLTRLRSGDLIEPVKPDPDQSKGQLGHTEQAVAKSELAKEMLARIYTNFPETVRAVRDHELAERRRLSTEYDETYNWR